MTFILLHFQSFLTDRGRCCGIGQRDNINSSKQTNKTMIFQVEKNMCNILLISNQHLRLLNLKPISALLGKGSTAPSKKII